MGIRLISHNVRGFNSSHKRKKAFRIYQRLQADIILLQETHFSENNHPIFFDSSYGLGHFTTFGSRFRGVAIFVRNSLMFDVENIYKDPASRFIILQGCLQGKKVRIANVYAPNNSQATFFKSFFQILDKYTSPLFHSYCWEGILPW